MLIAFVFNLFNNQRQITMKKLLPTTTLITLGIAAPAFAQTFIDGFSGGYDSSAWTEVTASGPSFNLKNPDTFSGEDFLNYYTSGVPTGSEQVFLNYGGSAPSSPTNLQDFSVSLDATNFASGLTSSASTFAQIGLNINNAGVTEGFNLHNGAYFVGGFGGSSDVQFFDGTNFAQPSDFATSVTLLLDFSAASQTFTLSYASTNTSSAFVPFASLNIDGTGVASGTDYVDDWAMGTGEAFDINIYALSNVEIANQAAGFGFLNADNFQLTVVPEPSAYAALAGALVLGLAAVRRRRA